MKELLFKILVVGDFGVGKTAIIRRYTEGMFSANYKLTIGVDFAVKSIQWDEKTSISLQLWDIAGHERFGYMTRVYYKYAIAAIVVCDLTRPATFDSILKWLSDVKEKVTLHDGQHVPVILLANKCDIEDVHLDAHKLNQFCQQQEILKWFNTSAKNDININIAIEYLIRKIIQIKAGMDMEEEDGNSNPGQPTTKGFKLTRDRPGKSKCCG